MTRQVAVLCEISVAGFVKTLTFAELEIRKHLALEQIQYVYMHTCMYTYNMCKSRHTFQFSDGCSL